MGGIAQRLQLRRGLRPRARGRGRHAAHAQRPRRRHPRRARRRAERPHPAPARAGERSQDSFRQGASRPRQGSATWTSNRSATSSTPRTRMRKRRKSSTAQSRWFGTAATPSRSPRPPRPALSACPSPLRRRRGCSSRRRSRRRQPRAQNASVDPSMSRVQIDDSPSASLTGAPPFAIAAFGPVTPPRLGGSRRQAPNGIEALPGEGQTGHPHRARQPVPAAQLPERRRLPRDLHPPCRHLSFRRSKRSLGRDPPSAGSPHHHPRPRKTRGRHSARRDPFNND